MAKKSKPTIVEFVTDSQLLGLSISPAQESLLRAIYGMSLNKDQMDLWQQCTGREIYPGQPFPEITVIAGARAGKDSRIVCPSMAYEGVFGGHTVSRGELPVMPIVAQDSRATKIAFGYLRDYLTGSSLLKQKVDDVLSQEIRLKSGLSISCFPSTLRSLRGWSIPSACMDELSFYRLEGQADSDVEIQASIRRGMLNFDNNRLLKISTPYMRSGVLYEDFKNYWGQDSPDVLVWKASSLLYRTQYGMTYTI